MAKNGKSRSRTGVSFESTCFTIPDYLLLPLDEYCLKHDRKRSEVVTRALKVLLAIEEAKDPAFWMERYQQDE